MFSTLRISLISLSLGLLLFVGDSSAKILTLEFESDFSGLWIDNSCHYSENTEDFWVYGCPINTPESLDPLGFWTTCKTKTCDLIFNAGYLPKAKRITLGAYIEGTPTISILGKISHNDLIFYLPIGEISTNGSAQWKEVEIELPTSVAALKFTLGSEGGYILLDYVTVDLGSEIPEAITLDTEANEIESHWTVDTCVYANDYRDFLYHGCPAEPQDTDQSLSGFWTPCILSSCQLQFFSGTTIHPTSLFVRAYLSGSAEIRVTSKLDPKSGTNGSQLVRNINTENAGSGWIDVTIDIDGYPDYTVVVIELVGSREDSILLDLLAVCLYNNAPLSCIPASTGTPTWSTEPLTGSTGTPTGTTEPLTGSTANPTGPTEPLTGSTGNPTGPTEPLTGSTGNPTGPTEPLTGSTGNPTWSTEPLTGSTEVPTEPAETSTEPSTPSPSGVNRSSIHPYAFFIIIVSLTFKLCE